MNTNGVFKIIDFISKCTYGTEQSLDRVIRMNKVCKY